MNILKGILLFVLAIFNLNMPVTYGLPFLPTDSITEKHEAIILNDYMSINISGKKGAFIYFNIDKVIRVKILSEKGLEEFKQIRLPQQFDPTYFVHAPEARNVGYYLSKIQIQSFKTKIIRQDKQIYKDDYVPEVIQIKSVDHTDDFYNFYDLYTYHIDNLEVGDELEVQYKYHFPFGHNFFMLSSLRLFFHGEYYKKHHKLSLSFSQELLVELAYINGADPDSIYEANKKNTYIWENNDLPGCINEPGSRGYLTLPHVIFSLKPWELLYTVPYSFDEKFLPYYVFAAGFRERKHLDILRATQFGVNTRQYEKLREFIKVNTPENSNDTTGYENLFNIHTLIVDEFKYDNDIDYFSNNVPFDEKLGNYVINHTIRDISRYNLYVALISSLGLNYFTAYIADKRIGVISRDYFTPMFENDYLLAVLLNDGKICFILPKSSRFGLYLDELPFYYESTPVRLVHINDYAYIKSDIKDYFRSVETPKSGVLDNVRMSNILTQINLQAQTISFEARISLSGQYSTMTRGIYLYDVSDPTVNPMYNKKIWDIKGNIELINQQVNIEQKEFPFKTCIRAKYKSDDLVSQHDSIYIISCGGWFTHIVTESLDTLNRFLDFYPDFKGKDTYNYFLNFNQDIVVIDNPRPIHINNEYGEFTFSCDQINSSSVKITSFLSIVNPKIPAQEINKIARIFKAASDLDKLNIRVKPGISE